MKIKFHGNHSLEEAQESLSSVMQVLKDEYGIAHFRDMELTLILLNKEGEDVELLDVTTSEVLDVFDVFKMLEEEEEEKPVKAANLKLVVDNTKKKNQSG